MKIFLINLAIIISSLVLLFLTSILLDLAFIQKHLVRQLLVYVIMLIISFVSLRILKLINFPTKLVNKP